MRIPLALLIAFISVTPIWAQADSAKTKIAEGRSALATHDLTGAKARFAEALALEPGNEDAAALLGLTRMFALTQATETQPYLDGLGIAPTGRDPYQWTADFSRDVNGHVDLSTGYYLATGLAFWRDVVVPECEAARANFAVITTPDFFLTLRAREVDNLADLQVDRGDILMARAILRAVEFAVHFLHGQNLDANLDEIFQLAAGDLLSLPRLVNDNPNLLKAGSLAERTAARAALLDLARIYRQASGLIRARAAEPNHLFAIDELDLPSEAEFRANLDKLERSFDEFIDFGTSGEPALVRVGPLFTEDFAWRDALPPFSDTGFNPYEIPDLSVGGTLSGWSRERLASVVGRRGAEPELGWEWVHPLPDGNQLEGYAYGNGVHVAVGPGANVLTSADGVTWTRRTLPPASYGFDVPDLRAVAFSGERFIAGGSGAIFGSSDGATWRELAYSQLNSIAYGGSRWVSVSSGGASTFFDSDPLSPNYSAVFPGFSGNEVLYAGGQFLVVGRDYLGRARIGSSFDGSIWTDRYTSAAGNLRAIASSGTRFVAVGDNNLLVTSADGTVWTATQLLPGAAAPPAFVDVAFLGGKFVATGFETVGSLSHTVIASSNDGLAWSLVTATGLADLHAIHAGPDAFYAFGAGGQVLRSTDGIAFVPRAGYQAVTPAMPDLNEVLAHDGRLEVFGANGSRLTSTNGITIVPGTTGVAATLFSAMEEGSLAIAVGAGGTILASTNGTDWETRTSGTSADLHIVARLNGTYVSAGGSGTLLTSPDGVTWTPRATGLATDATLYGVAFGNGLYLAAGGTDQGEPVFISSTDGAGWTPITHNVWGQIRGLAFHGGRFVGVNDLGDAMWSVDGTFWEPGRIPHNLVLGFTSLRVVAGRLVGTTNVDYYSGHGLAISGDGREWLASTVPTTNPTNAATSFNDRLYVVGDDASILRSGTIPGLVAPSILAPAVSRVVSPGATATLAAGVAGDAFLDIEWSKNGVPIPGASDVLLRIENVQASNAGDYHFAASNVSGSATSGTAALTVDASTGLLENNVPWAGLMDGELGARVFHLVVPSGQARLVIQISGGAGNADLYVRRGSAPSLTDWDYRPLLDGSDEVVTIDNPDGVDWYILVRGTSPYHDVSLVARYTDVPVAPAFLLRPRSMTALPGETVTLTAAATGTGPLTYEWRKDGVPISTANSNVLTLPAVFLSDTGDYEVIVSNAVGSVTADPAAHLGVEAPYAITTWVGLASPGSSDGIGSAARFLNPHGVAMDAAGNAYVADTENHTVRKVTPAGVVTSLAGSAGQSGSVDGTGSAARFNFPEGVAVDGAGNVYVADHGNYTIRRISPAGVVTTLAGTAGYSGNVDGVGAGARFGGLKGLAVDAVGNLYVVDEGAIRKVTPGGVVTTLVGNAAMGSADGTGLAARFSYPDGLAMDGAGNLFVADTGNSTIRKVTPTRVVTTVAGSAHQFGSTDGVGAAARFNSPNGVALDSAGTIYVADGGNQTIRKITTLGVVTTVAGTVGKRGGNDGAGNLARFTQPHGLVVDPNGTIVVVDSLNNAIRKVTPAGIVTTLAGVTRANVDGTTSAARFNYPQGVAVDGAGNAYIADSENHTIRKVTPDGLVTTLAGSAGEAGSADGIGVDARFYYPEGVALDGDGDILVADSVNHTIRKVTPDGVVTTLAGSPGASGEADGVGSAARFSSPYGIAVDGAGNIVVADSENHAIRRITPAGEVSTLAGHAGEPGSVDGPGTTARFHYPEGVTVDGSGNIYVADSSNHSIRKISPGGDVTTLAGSPDATGSADGVGAGARFYFPGGLSVDGAGSLFVVDTENQTIRKVTPLGAVSTIAGKVGEIGSADGFQGAARFNSPFGIAVDASGTLHISDAANGTIRRGKLVAIPEILSVTTEHTMVNQGFIHAIDATNSPALFTASGLPAGLSVDAATGIISGTPTVAGVFNVDLGTANIAGIGTATLTLIVAPAVVSDQGGTIVTSVGGATTLSVSTTGGENPDFQWQILSEGGGPLSAGSAAAEAIWQDIPGATGRSYTIPSTQRFHGGSYRAIVTANGVSTASDPVTLTVDAAPAPNNARLLNLSTRGLAGAGANQLFPGFVVQGTGTKRLLIRAVGPTLAAAPINFPFPVAPDPRMELKRYNFATSTYEDVNVNDDWQTNPNAPDIITASGALGAFPLTDPKDATLLVDLPSGQYAVVAGDKNGTSGIAIVELYDADSGNPSTRLINISNRGFAGVGAEVMIPGFVVSDEGPKTLLVRVVGPTLGSFNVPGTMADPKLTIYKHNFTTNSDDLLLTDDNWSDNPDATYTAQIATQVLAFPLNEGSTDAAFVVTLNPGVYTVIGSSADGVGTGIVLVEVYVVQ